MCLGLAVALATWYNKATRQSTDFLRKENLLKNHRKGKHLKWIK